MYLRVKTLKKLWLGDDPFQARDVRCSGVGLVWGGCNHSYFSLGIFCDKQHPHDFLPFFEHLVLYNNSDFGLEVYRSWEDSNLNSFTAST